MTRATLASTLEPGDDPVLPARAVETVPIYRPLLPGADRLAGYLARIDHERWYTNNGPLVRELETRISDQLGFAMSVAATAANGTQAIAAAVLATAGRATAERPLCLLPSYTFIGTAMAVEQCGYEPCLVDIDPHSWMIDPQLLAEHPDLERVGAVVVVSAFGRPVPQAAWRRFQAATGIPVVIDGAAAIEALVRRPDETVGEIPVAISLHATKPLSTGEGGAVICGNATTLDRARSALNFGFGANRQAIQAGFNGKMSEYHAAVGLADLDGWTRKRRGYAGVARAYRELSHGDGRLHLAPDSSSTYALFLAETAAEATALTVLMSARGLEWRRWYGGGLHCHPYLARVRQASSLAVTDDIASRLIGLPMSVDLTTEAVRAVVGALSASVTMSVHSAIAG